MDAHGMIGHLIRRLHQKSTQVFTRRMTEAGFDLTSVQFAALDAINANPGIDQARVAEAIAFDRATIGGVIDRLERKGLVIRRISPTDRRARVLDLSPEGQAVYAQILPIVADLQSEIVSSLTADQRSTLHRLLGLALREEGE